MFRAVTPAPVSFALLLLLSWDAGINSAYAEDSIGLRNGMTAPITVLVTAEQQSSPVQIRILAGNTYTFSLTQEGLYTIQVIPDDQPESGYHLGSHDLRQLSRALNGQPLQLEGDFTTLMDLRNGAVFRERTAAHFHVPQATPGWGMRISGRRVDYMQARAGDQQANEPMPTGGRAVISVVVPENARVFIDGDPTNQTGPQRFFTTPALTPGKTSYYNFKVEWNENGRRRTETRKVPVRANEVSRVYFQLPVAAEPVTVTPVIFVPVIVVPVPQKVPEKSP
jgi:uncharacterized protein (TIGR03000 family)